MSQHQNIQHSIYDLLSYDNAYVFKSQSFGKQFAEALDGHCAQWGMLSYEAEMCVTVSKITSVRGLRGCWWQSVVI